MKNQISILACDLGSSLGWARCSCVIRPEIKLTVIDKGTVYLDQLVNDRMRKSYNEVYTRSRVKMIVFEETIRKLLDMGKFDAYVAEDVFMMPKRVSAFRALSLYIEAMEMIVNREKMKRLHMIPTRLCKKHIAEFGGADKTQVQDAVLNHPNIVLKRADKLTEHEADAIAVAYALVKEYLVSLT